MDVNGDKEDSRTNLLADTALKDSITHVQPNLESQPTYHHGHKRLDYILVSDEVIELSTTTCHTSYDYHFVFDHSGVYMDISVDCLFDDHLLDPTDFTEHKLQINRPDIVRNTAQLVKL